VWVMGAVCRNAKHGGRTVMEGLIMGGVSIAECGGKANVTQFCDVLDSLGVRKFVIWDGDMHHKEKRKRGEARGRNMEIIEKPGLGPEFLDRVEGSGEAGCVIGDGRACFGFDGETYFAACFKARHKGGLEAEIKRGTDLDGRPGRHALEGTGFFREAVPAIHDRFARGGGA